MCLLRSWVNKKEQAKCDISVGFSKSVTIVKWSFTVFDNYYHHGLQGCLCKVMKNLHKMLQPVITLQGCGKVVARLLHHNP